MNGPLFEEYDRNGIGFGEIVEYTQLIFAMIDMYVS